MGCIWVAAERADVVVTGLAARLVELYGQQAAAERLPSVSYPAAWNRPSS